MLVQRLWNEMFNPSVIGNVQTLPAFMFFFLEVSGFISTTKEVGRYREEVQLADEQDCRQDFTKTPEY